MAQEVPRHNRSEATLELPDLNGVKFFNDLIGGRDLLWVGLVVSIVGIGFGLVSSAQLKRLPVHSSMLQLIRAETGGEESKG